MFCKECGSEINDNAVMCVKCGVAVKSTQASGQSNCSRVGYILLALFLGVLGIHNFYAGYSGKGIAQLLITLLLGWLILPWLAVIIWNIIEICTVTKDAQGVPFS